MPKVPQQYADERLTAGPVAPEASPLAFNGAAGLEQLGAGLFNAGDTLHRINVKKAADDEARWLVNSTHQYQLEATQFENDPANNGREDFGLVTREHLEARKQEYLSQAPNGRAATRLEAHLNNIIESRFARAAHVSEQTKLANGALEIDRSISSAMQAYRADAANSAEYARANLEPMMDLLQKSVIDRWGQAAPQAASKFLEHIETQFIAGTAEHDPQYARKLLNEATFIDETKKLSLGNMIDANERSINVLEAFQFNDAVNEMLKDAQLQQKPAQDVPQSAFDAVLGKEAGAKAKAQFDLTRKEINQGIAFVDGVEGKNPSAMAESLRKLIADPNVRADTKTAAARAVGGLIRQAQQDPHAYLNKHNYEVGKAYQFASETGTPDAFKRANNIALEYQGYAPVDAPSSEQGKYLNLPTNARRLMGKAEAEATIGAFINGTPDEQIMAIDRMLLKYPQEQRAIAFNGLIDLPEGKRIMPLIQWGFLHRDKAWVKDYLGAQKPEAVKLAENKKDFRKEKFEQAISDNGTWSSFALAMDDGTQQRAVELLGFRESLVNYAYGLFGAGVSESKAVREASDRLIGSAFGFPKVNGVAVMVARERSDKTMRTDDEIKNLEQVLAFALDNVPTEQVKPTAPDGRVLFPNKDERSLKDHIRQHGFFVPTPDGQGATLYMTLDDRVPVQLLDKNNQPWEVDFDSLPAIERIGPSPTSRFTWTQPKDVVRGRFWKNYPVEPKRPSTGTYVVP